MGVQGRFHFASYARKDESVVRPILDELDRAGVRVWYDTGRLQGGESWPTTIDHAIKNAGKFILMMTPAAIRSREVRRELDLARTEQKTIVPVRVRPTQIPKSLEPVLGHLHTVTITDYRRERTGLLIEALGESAEMELPPTQRLAFRLSTSRIAEHIRFINALPSMVGPSLPQLSPTERTTAMSSSMRCRVISTCGARRLGAETGRCVTD